MFILYFEITTCLMLLAFVETLEIFLARLSIAFVEQFSSS